MSYMDIDNLYKARDILLFRRCYAMEKIHGTSAHVGWKDGKLSFFSGGADSANFVKLFDQPDLCAKLAGQQDPAVIYGEAYGGKMQGMRDTYGDSLRFVAFEVQIGEHCFLSVPQAEEFVRALGLDFVAWREISTDLDALDAERDSDSVQAVRNGCGEGKPREGIVLRPLVEVRKNNGERIIAKHKREVFRETKGPRPVNAEKLAVLTAAQAIADEWVTEMRLTHVLDAFPDAGIEQTGPVIAAMVADVEREAAGEIVTSKEARAAIGKATALMFKRRLQATLRT